MSKKIKQLLRTIKLGTIDRAAQFDADTIDQEARTIELSYSSEEPYERYWGVEILGHDPNEVRLGRINNAGAFLMDHNTRDQVGVVEKAWIDSATRKGRALVRFGKGVRASEIFQDVIDGIRKNVSVSYSVIRMKLMKSEKVNGGTETIDTFRVTEWEPLEISLVSVPADTTVGIGREQDNQNQREVPIETDKEERSNMEKCIICGADLLNGKCPACARAKEDAERAAKIEESRVSEILAIGKKHNLMDDALTFVTGKKSVDEFKNHVIDKISAGQGNDIDGEHRAAATSPDQPIYRGSNATMLGAQLADIRKISDPKYNGDEVRQARSRLDQNNRRYMERMVALAKREDRAAATGGATMGVPADGGMFLQGETVAELMTNGFNNSEILPRMAKRTLTATQFIEVIGIDEQSRRDGSRGGGIRVYNDKELGSVDPSKTQFSKVRVEPKKLTGLFYASEEWERNATFMGQEVRSLFGEEFAFKCQNIAIRGTGAGEGLGALNAPCLVSVAKETGQKSGTILTTNLSKMWARYNGMAKNAAWFINRDCNPQLDELAISVGSGALEPRFVNYGPDGILRIKGAPVIEIEQCESVGTVGDIILADWSQVIAADQGDINEAMSIHVNFIYGQNTYRFTYYFDCQPRWKSAITPFKGSNTVSPLVALASR